MNTAMDVIVTTADNLSVVRETLPTDQRGDLVPGCRTWGILMTGGGRGQMTVYPTQRGALCLGGDSAWGDWDSATRTLSCDSGPVTVDDAGNEVPDTAE